MTPEEKLQEMRSALVAEYDIDEEEIQLIAKSFLLYLVPKQDEERRAAAVVSAECMALIAIMFAANHPPK